MANTYGGQPNESNRDFVRFRVGDTNADATGEWLLTDSEIDSLLAIHGSKFKAAAAGARAIAARFSRRVDSTMGKLKLTLSQKVKQYRALAEEIEREQALAGGAATVWAAAHLDSRKETYEEDTDRVEPAFAVGMHDQVGTDQTSARSLNSTGI